MHKRTTPLIFGRAKESCYHRLVEPVRPPPETSPKSGGHRFMGGEFSSHSILHSEKNDKKAARMKIDSSIDQTPIPPLFSSFENGGG